MLLCLSGHHEQKISTIEVNGSNLLFIFLCDQITEWYECLWNSTTCFRNILRKKKSSRKKAIGPMISTLTVDKSNIIKAEGPVVICQSERRRHVRVIRWAQWGACGLTRVNIISESSSHRFSPSHSMGVWLKEYSGVTVYVFAKLSLLSKVKNTKTFSKANSQQCAIYLSLLKTRRSSQHENNFNPEAREGRDQVRRCDWGGADLKLISKGL